MLTNFKNIVIPSGARDLGYYRLWPRDDDIKSRFRRLFETLLTLSIILGLIPLAGVAWIVLYGSIATVDGLFMSLILLALSGILFLNVLLSFRKRAASTERKAN